MPVSHLTCPLPPNQSVIWLGLYHHFPASPCHHITRSPHHHVSVICLAPCNQTSQSFALPPTTKPVSHLTWPLPPLPRITMLPHHQVTISPHHHISESFALPPVTKPVSHLTCPLATKPVSHLTCPLPLHHHITALPHQSVICLAPLPPNQSVICLAPCHQTSQSFALPPTTKPVRHLTCPLPLHHRITTSLRQSVICLAPLPPNQSVIWPALYHCITVSPHHHIPALVSHLSCPLPPNQSVICRTPTTKPVSHLTWPLPPLPHKTMSPRHHITTSVSHLPCPL